MSKNEIAKRCSIAFVASICFLIWGCSPPPQNTNQSANSGGNVNTTATVSTPCTKESITAEMDRIIKSVGIENQHNGMGAPNNKKYFEFRVDQIDSKWVVYVEGGISDGKQNNPNSNSEYMEKLIKDVDQLVKKTCVDRVVFVRSGSFESVDQGKMNLRDVQGFNWSACEWPAIACPDGQCHERCPEVNPNMTPGPSSNSNMGSNSNSNSNTNSKVNRAP
jgi:hypothetical protein